MQLNQDGGQHRILIAGTADAVEIARAALGKAFQYTCAYSLEEALALLDRSIDVILSNVRFDDSRMFDFLQSLRHTPEFRDLPVVCFRAPDKELSDTVHRAVEAAIHAFDEVTFIDLYAIACNAGVPIALSELRKAVCSRISR